MPQRNMGDKITFLVYLLTFNYNLKLATNSGRSLEWIKEVITFSKFENLNIITLLATDEHVGGPLLNCDEIYRLPQCLNNSRTSHAFYLIASRYLFTQEGYICIDLVFS